MGHVTRFESSFRCLIWQHAAQCGLDLAEAQKLHALPELPTEPAPCKYGGGAFSENDLSCGFFDGSGMRTFLIDTAIR